MNRTSLLLVIGLVFLGLALLSLTYPSGPSRPEERSHTTQNIPGGTMQPPVTCMPPAGWKAHIVQPDETLGKIALDAGISVQELVAGNCQIGNENLIYAGQEIYLPPRSPATAQPGSTPSSPSYVIETEWPVRIGTKSSSTIRISLLRTPDGLVPTVEIQGTTGVVSTLTPVGTLEGGLPSAFGDQYEGYATAHLEGTSFDIQLASPEVQSLKEPHLSWVWNIRPENPGQQGINGYIEIEWKPIGSAGKSEKRQVSSFHLDIEVLQPQFYRGQVNVFSLVIGVIGLGLSAPWLYQVYNRRRTERRRKDRTHI